MNNNLLSVISLISEAVASSNFVLISSLVKDAVVRDEGSIDYIIDIGVKCAREKNYSAAEQIFVNLQAFGHTRPIIFYNLGLLYSIVGEHQKAINSYDFALKINPQNLEVLLNKGLVLIDSGNYDLAIGMFNKVIALNPNYAEAYFNKGVILGELNRHEESLVQYDKVIALNPNYAETYFNKGVILGELNRHEESLAHYKKAISFRFNYPECHMNIGVELDKHRMHEEAVAQYEKAITLKPDYMECHVNMAHNLLLNGDFQKGWKFYEGRLNSSPLAECSRDIKILQNMVGAGGEALQNKRVLLRCEQGLGDTIQFSRYALMLSRLGARVMLEVQPQLIKIFDAFRSEAKVMLSNGQIPEHDISCPLMSLPLVFNTDLNSIPSIPGYITSDQLKVLKWTEKLGKKNKPRIGIAWSGNMDHKNDKNRSISLAQLLPHLGIDYEYICLQKDIREEDKKILSLNHQIKIYCDELNDFSETAALCQLMDLIVTVDTSVAHLSGALGRPTWVLLPYVPDWRWMHERADSPWYDSVKLLRQNQLNCWEGVLGRLGIDKQEYFTKYVCADGTVCQPS